jgi:hypothetical protein
VADMLDVAAKLLVVLVFINEGDLEQCLFPIVDDIEVLGKEQGANNVIRKMILRIYAILDLVSEVENVDGAWCVDDTWLGV